MRRRIRTIVEVKMTLFVKMYGITVFVVVNVCLVTTFNGFSKVRQFVESPVRFEFIFCM